MNIREYYDKRQKILAGLPAGFVVVISEATPDGGRAGLRSEVERKLAAKLISEGRAREASAEEAAAFRRDANRGRVRLDQRTSKR